MDSSLSIFPLPQSKNALFWHNISSCIIAHFRRKYKFYSTELFTGFPPPFFVIAFPVPHTPSLSLLSQCRIPFLCHCEPVLRLVWQSCGRLTMAGIALRFPRQSSAAALCRAQPPKAALSAEQCALPRNDGKSVIAFPVPQHWCGNLSPPGSQ